MAAIEFTEQDGMPEGWRVARLGDVAETRKETVDPRNGKYRYVGLEHIDQGVPQLKRFGYSDEVRSAKSKFYSGDILYGKLRPYLDKCVLIDFEGICSTDIIVIKMNNNISNKFLSYFLHVSDFREYATKTMTGVNHPRTSWRALSQFSIPLPPLPEQHRIAAVLSAVQDVKEKTGAVIAAAKSLKKSLMRHLFTYGPVPAGAAESVPLAETEIGLVPEGWRVLPIGQISEIIMGQSPPGRSYNTDGIGVPLINGPAEFGESFPRSTKWTVSPTKTCVSGDILFCVRGNTTGRMNVADSEYCIGRGVAAIRSIDGLSETSYLFYFLKKEADAILALASAGGSTFPNITKSQLRNFSTPTPPLPTQQKIAHILSTVDKKIEAEENKKTALERLFKTLLNNLMTAKIRVDDMVI